MILNFNPLWIFIIMKNCLNRFRTHLFEREYALCIVQCEYLLPAFDIIQLQTCYGSINYYYSDCTRSIVVRWTNNNKWIWMRCMKCCGLILSYEVWVKYIHLVALYVVQCLWNSFGDCEYNNNNNNNWRYNQ